LGKALSLKVLGGLTQKGKSLSLIDVATEESNLFENNAPLIAIDKIYFLTFYSIQMP